MSSIVNANRKAIAAFGFAFTLYAVLAQSIISVETSMESGMTFLQASIRYISFLTILTNAAMCMVFLAALVRGQKWLSYFRKPQTRAIVAATITLVAFYYHFLIAPENPNAGMEKINDLLLHYVNPLLYVFWFVGFNRSGTLTYRKVLVMLVPIVVYFAYVMMRGEITGQYPYDIINAREFGYLAALKGAAIIATALILLNALYVAVDRSILVTKPSES